MANVFEPDFDDVSEREGFSWRAARLANQAGAERLGASLYELAPGQTICPYHAHLANEEMLIVVEGRPSLRDPDGWRELASGELVSFPLGTTGAHQVANFGGERARVLLLSERNAPEIALYLDSGKVLAREQAPGTPATGYRKAFRDSDEVDYWEGETPPQANP